MTSEQSIALVRAYYGSYRAGTAEAVTSALGALVADDFELSSPLVEARFGGPVSGATAMAAAAGVAPFLANVTVERLYVTADGDGVASLINFPSPVGVVVQSEHFDLDPTTQKITRLRSYYDPRPLLPS